jgi:hypothetical protein
MNIKNFLSKIKSKVTPVRVFATLLVIIGLLDHLSNPIDVYTEPTSVMLETFIRAIFIFAGLFCIIGNGRTTKIRTTIVGIPYLYLAFFYGMRVYFEISQASLIPCAITTFLGLWLVIEGENYESTRPTNISLTTCNANRRNS